MGRDIVISKGDVHPVLCQHGAYLIYIVGKGGARNLHIVVGKLYRPTLAQSLVWLRGAAAPYHDGVGKEPVLLLELRVNKPIASPKQEYQHEYSPRYGKSC